MNLIVSFTALIIFIFVPVVSNYRILALIPYNGRSHFIMFEPLLKELASRGHEVDVLSHFPQKEKIPRYTDYSLVGTLPVLVGNVSYDSMTHTFFLSFLRMVLSDYGLDICKTIFNSDAATALRDSKNSYDLILTEIFFFDCMYGFSHHFNAPVIAISTNVDFPWGASRIGNPTNPSYIPNYFLSYLSKMSLWERTWNTIYYGITWIYYGIYGLEYGTQLTRNFFNDQSMPSLSNLISNKTSLIFINTHFSINYVSPKVPNFIEIAGIHINPQRPLPQNLLNELNIGDNYKGVVYMSFGSLIAVETLPLNILRSFFDSFKELPYKVLFKGPREKLISKVNVPSNVHFEKWMPQRDILCHPNVKLFISHGGLMGTQEGIYCGVPTLGLPIFADQELNIANSQARGLALKLKFNEITKESFLTAVRTLLEDPSYKENAEKTSKLFRDRPQSALDTALYWTEYTLKYKGVPHLRSVSADLAWYQYYLIDVACVIIFVIFSLTTLCRIVLKKIRKVLSKRAFKMPDVKKKN
ncbi:UDP-glucuronosyltransferase 2B31 [Agrilus planipennis]|uniref:UDP-glucuronosyltransferase n=1 Tax=Agrilus planipennis TaxID=224129 RepID=A0A1W4W691_AGRPL|nr:UDP-glucuronosyltransferase 2B31 [Agrilus planipennis]